MANEYERSPAGTVCGYIHAPTTADELRRDRARPCNRPAAIRCHLHGLPPIDLCIVCYEQQRCESEPHWTSIHDWNSTQGD